MTTICAWCLREGGPGDLGEQMPFDDPAPTHGICSRHAEQVLESLPSGSFPDVELLIVVRPGEIELYEYLQRTFAGLRLVIVIMERRLADRRRGQHLVADDRRRRRRRIRQGKIFPGLGYTVVRFKRPTGA